MFPSRAESVSHICGNITLSYWTDEEVAPFLQTWWAFLPLWPNLENTPLRELHTVEHQPYFHFNLAVIGLAQSKREISMLQLAWAPWMMVFWFYSQEKGRGLNKTNRQKKKKPRVNRRAVTCLKVVSQSIRIDRCFTIQSSSTSVQYLKSWLQEWSLHTGFSSSVQSYETKERKNSKTHFVRFSVQMIKLERPTSFT